jgi:beta-lactamase superfamily II metal-dependent hydrolase
MKIRHVLLPFCLVVFSVSAFGQANGKLQIHHMDVGQGDGAILISPRGETVLFDNGDAGNCRKPVRYLQRLGVTRIDYMIVSHLHSDHFGCTAEVLNKFPLIRFSYDRGGTYDSGAFEIYAETVGNKRRTATPSTTITLDANTPNPVTINIAALNGAGVNTRNENDLSIVAVVHFGAFDAMMAGDLSGFRTRRYKDIETPVAQIVGQVEVYKVNHHGSDHSSNPIWLQRIRPRVAVISVGNWNGYDHPTVGCLRRLHNAGIAKTYWTEEGDGAYPVPGRDIVSNGAVVVQMAPGADRFTVSYGSGTTDTHRVWPTPYNGQR